MNRSLLAATFAAALLTGCSVGPKYNPPQVATAPTWKTEGPWRQAAPKDALPKGAWWEVFQDAQLNDYEQQLLKANPSLVAAKDRLDQARALARVATAGYFPQVSADPGALRERLAANRPSAAAPFHSLSQNVFTIPFALNYEPDLFGRVRKNVEAANASLQANAADLQNVQLVLSAELAADYFSLRELDAEYKVVQRSVDEQKKALDYVQNRHVGGVASGLEVAQQATVLDSTVAQLSLVQQQREQFEHAIAVLTGNQPSTFSVPVEPLHVTPPPVPLGVPSDVLERRPDIAEAERNMAFANAQVGIAKTAFYPQLTISGGTGLQSTSLSSLATSPNIVWSLGADLLQPIVNGGRNRANLAATQAAYNQSVDNYRQTVLTAFQQVEDGLTGLNTLSEASKSQEAAVEDARKALEIATNRYQGGLDPYLNVITAETTLLANERLETQLLGQQMVTSVALVKALGGGWNAAEIKSEQVHPQPGQILQQ